MGFKGLLMEVADPRFSGVGTFGSLIGASQGYDHVVGKVLLVRTSEKVFGVGFHRSLGFLDRHRGSSYPYAPHRTVCAHCSEGCEKGATSENPYLLGRS